MDTSAILVVLVMTMTFLQNAGGQPFPQDPAGYCAYGRPVVDENGVTLTSCGFFPSVCPDGTSCTPIPTLPDFATPCCFPDPTNDPCASANNPPTCNQGEVCTPIRVICVGSPCYPEATCRPISVPPRCPPPSNAVGICVFDPSINCLSDQECTINGQICCPEGCNSVCRQQIDITPCALILCAAGQICVERQVQCIRAPCPPVGECVPDVCEEGRPAADSNGNSINCGRGGSTCPRDYECIIDPADRYALCCRETDDDDTNVGLIVGVVGGVVVLIIIIIIIICCCCCCGCCGDMSGNHGDGCQGNMMQCGGGCCFGPPPPRHQTIKVMGNHQPAHYPVPSPVQYPSQQVNVVHTVQVPGIHNAVAPMGISSAVAPMGFRKLNCQY